MSGLATLPAHDLLFRRGRDGDAPDPGAGKLAGPIAIRIAGAAALLAALAAAGLLAAALLAPLRPAGPPPARTVAAAGDMVGALTNTDRQAVAEELKTVRALLQRPGEAEQAAARARLAALIERQERDAESGNAALALTMLVTRIDAAVAAIETAAQALPPPASLPRAAMMLGAAGLALLAAVCGIGTALLARPAPHAPPAEARETTGAAGLTRMEALLSGLSRRMDEVGRALQRARDADASAADGALAAGARLSAVALDAEQRLLASVGRTVQGLAAGAAATAAEQANSSQALELLRAGQRQVARLEQALPGLVAAIARIGPPDPALPREIADRLGLIALRLEQADTATDARAAALGQAADRLGELCRVLTGVGGEAGEAMCAARAALEATAQRLDTLARQLVPELGARMTQAADALREGGQQTAQVLDGLSGRFDALGVVLDAQASTLPRLGAGIERVAAVVAQIEALLVRVRADSADPDAPALLDGLNATITRLQGAASRLAPPAAAPRASG